MYFVSKFGLLLVKLETGRSETKYPLDLTIDEFIDLLRHILVVSTTEEHNKREISVVGRSGCRLSKNIQFVGLGTNAVKNSHYFLACNAVVMLKIEAMPGCTRTTGCS